MEFFLDTASLEEIRTADSWGLLDGVTTNPTHVSKENMPFLDLVKAICDICGERPVSAEVVATECEGIVKEARKIVKVAENVVVKVPVIREGIKAMSILSKEGVKINATLDFSAVQALIAAKAGATYISPFIGRLDAIGHEGMHLVREIRQIYDNYGMTTKIITASIRHPQHVLDAALAGSDVATMRFETMGQLFTHPLTDAGVARFLADWARIPEKLRTF